MANNTFRLSMVMLALWMAVPRTACSCTALCLLDGRRPVVARNYDWHIGEGLVITNKKDVSKVALTYDRPAKWTSAYGSLTFNQYGREFPCGGMNEAGLVVTGIGHPLQEFDLSFSTDGGAPGSGGSGGSRIGR